MKLTCEKNELQKSVSIVTKAVAVKSPVYLLEGILINASENMMTLYGSDGTLSIKCTCNATGCRRQGKVVLPARLLNEILAKFDECEVHLYTEGNNLVIECGHSRTTLCYMDAEAYPAFPQYDQTNGISILSNQLVSMIDQTVFAASMNEDKPILTGILLELNKEYAKTVALDGYRLAIRQETIQADINHTEVVVPSKSMREIARIVPEDERTIWLYASEKMVSIICDNIEITTRVLQGDYVKYKSILPTEYATRMIVEKQNLQNSLEIASILARQSKTNLVNFKIEKDLLTITSDSEIGKAREQVGIQLMGKSLDISFNVRYLLDVLKEVDDEEIVLDFNTNISPCVIHPMQGENYLYLVLPVKTNTVN